MPIGYLVRQFSSEPLVCLNSDRFFLLDFLFKKYFKSFMFIGWVYRTK